MVVWLLSLGADPNGDEVMYYGARGSTADILQPLIDAGGDVNRKSRGEPLLHAVHGSSEDNVRVLLGQPSLDCTIKYYFRHALEVTARHCTICRVVVMWQCAFDSNVRVVLFRDAICVVNAGGTRCLAVGRL